jgi:hypothetical protein
MSGYGLPTSAELGGRPYSIRSDYRAVLDVLGVMGDGETGDDERTIVALSIFYEDFDSMPNSVMRDAVAYMQWFINGGDEPDMRPKPKLMDWEQDFPLIVAPVNRIVGKEIRAMEYLHWWTFLAAYREIGDCLFAQVVSIRKQMREGKKLDKADKRFYNENRALVDFKTKLSASDLEGLDLWIGGARKDV